MHTFVSHMHVHTLLNMMLVTSDRESTLYTFCSLKKEKTKSLPQHTQPTVFTYNTHTADSVLLYNTHTTMFHDRWGQGQGRRDHVMCGSSCWFVEPLQTWNHWWRHCHLQGMGEDRGRDSSCRKCTIEWKGGVAVGGPGQRYRSIDNFNARSLRIRSLFH